MRIPWACVLAVCLGAATVRATVLVPADLGELSRSAVAIARGRVVSVEGQWTDDHRSIETIVSLQVDEYLKGSLGSALQFRVPGGMLGRYRSIFVGAPEFAVDQQVVVFLGAQGPSVPHVLGLSQGVFRIVPDASGSGWLVTPPVMMPVAAITTVQRGSLARRPIALSAFEARVRALAGAAK
ncbi:MAG TPA: hypothetical protein VHU82_03355 [Vicinamibacterales bacterium]|jgi:hypothetical protein|nr:hypothetical protein [Vicinamibacterales bacterium]